jgi:DNA-binding SARP family transcriptional activator
MVDEKLSFAKITKPETAEIIKRPRLFEKMDRPGTGAVWVTGPGGSGKTTLAVSYVENRKTTCIWYQIDRGDADISTFFFYMGVAYKQATPKGVSTLPPLTPEHALGVDIFTRRYFEKLFAQLNKPAVLVLDNVHEAGKAVLLFEVIQEMIAVIPSNVRIILLSRHAPPTSFARYRANNTMAVIGWPELKFNFHETKEVLSRCGPSHLTHAQISNVHRKAGGWVAGIQLMLMQAETQKMNVDHMGHHTPEQVFNYFAHEIFRLIDPDRRKFLMTASILPVIHISIAEALTGLKRAEQILAELYRENFFTDKYVGKETTYQFHPLFQEFLFRCLENGWSADQITQVRQTAAKLLEDAGHLESALSLYLKNNDNPNAGAIILKKAERLVAQGRHRTLEEWIRRISNEHKTRDPWLLYWQGVSCMPFKPGDSEKIFESALERFEALSDPIGIFLSLSGILDSILFAFNNLTKSDKWLKKAGMICQTYRTFPTRDIEARLTASMLLAITFRNPQHPDFKAWEKRAENALKEDILPEYKILVIIPLVWHNLFSGRLPRAGKLIRQFQELAQSSNASPYALITLRHSQALLYWLSARFDAYRRSLKDGMNLEADSGVFLLRFFLLGNAVAGHLSMGDACMAERYLKQIGQTSEPMGEYQRSFVCYVKAYFHFLREEYSDALHNSEAMLGCLRSGGSVQPITLAHLMLAICFRSIGRKEQSIRHLTVSTQLCRKYKAKLVFFECLLTQAGFHLDDGKNEQALSALRQAFGIGRAEGYKNTWFWRPGEMARLCAKALEAGIEVKYVSNLIKKRELYLEKPSLELESWPWPIKIYTLGRFGLVYDGQPLKFKGKSQKKQLSVIKALISYGGTDVPQYLIQDALWPDKDGDIAYNSLSTAIYRLRKLVRNEKFLQVSDGTISLDNRYCWVDVWHYEKQLNEAKALWENGCENQSRNHAIALTHHLINCMKGPYLATEQESWVIAKRERIQNKILFCIGALGKHLQRQNLWEEAVDVYLKGIEIEPLSEESYKHLIGCYLNQGLVSEARRTYHRCLAIFGTVPETAHAMMSNSGLAQK